jgi:hypothetical protein
VKSHITDAELFIGDLVSVALGFSLIGVAATAADSHAWLGKFMLFRPTSLALFLALLGAMSVIARKGGAGATSAGLVTLILVAPFFGAATLGENLLEVSAAREREKVFEEIQARMERGTVVLIDPELEESFLAIERKTGLETYVMTKFVPSATQDMREWYARVKRRETFFSDVCGSSLSVADAAVTTIARWTEQEMGRCATQVTLSDGSLLMRFREPAG